MGANVRGGKLPSQNSQDAKRYKKAIQREIIATEGATHKAVVKAATKVKVKFHVNIGKGSKIVPLGVKHLDKYDADKVESYQSGSHSAKSIKVTGKGKFKAQEDARKADQKALKLASMARREEFIDKCKKDYFAVSKSRRLKKYGTLEEYINLRLNEEGF